MLFIQRSSKMTDYSHFFLVKRSWMCVIHHCPGWLRNYSASIIYFTLNVSLDFRTLLDKVLRPLHNWGQMFPPTNKGENGGGWHRYVSCVILLDSLYFSDFMSLNRLVHPRGIYPARRKFLLLTRTTSALCLAGYVEYHLRT